MNAILTTRSTVIARLDRAIQHAEPAQFDFDVNGYWMPRFRGV